MPAPLDFERPILDLEAKIDELNQLGSDGDLNISGEVGELRAKVRRLITQTYSRLTPWQRVQVARHPGRPRATRYIDLLVEGFVPFSGDRAYRDDSAVIGGMGRFRGRTVMVLGQEKGSDLETRMRHNFGMAHPEGYRKAQRLMRLADRFGLPVLSFVDTPGAYPGVEAEERGQAEAIARCIEVGLDLRVPFIASVIGEGGSGGAVALASADRVLMMEHAVYSVISPEGCASILWRSGENAEEAASALKLTGEDLLGLGVVDRVVPEPLRRGPARPGCGRCGVGRRDRRKFGSPARPRGRCAPPPPPRAFPGNGAQRAGMSSAGPFGSRKPAYREAGFRGLRIAAALRGPRRDGPCLRPVHPPESSSNPPAWHSRNGVSRFPHAP